MRFQNVQLDPFGVVFDTNPHDVPDENWTDVLNMRFKDNASQKFGGDSQATTTTAQGTHLLFNGNHNAPLWVYLGDGIARVTDFTTDKDIEGTALTSGINWDSSLFNLFPIVNNSIDQPRYWDKDFVTPGTLATLPGFPANTTCQSIRPFRSFLVALNTTVSSVDQPNRVLWSNSSDAGALPADWDIADPGSLAGDAYLTDDKGEIIDGWTMRDFFVIYKTHSTYLMRLIGGTAVMRIDKVQVNSGLLAKNCVTEFKGKHFVVADGDVVIFDGQNVESIAEHRVRRAIFGNIDPNNYTKTHVVRFDRKDEIWICYPSNGQSEVNRAAVWNWKSNNWTFRELNDTRYMATGLGIETVLTIDTLPGPSIDTLGTNWRPTIDDISANPTADSLHSIGTLAINTIDVTFDFNGAAMSTKLEKTTMDLGDPDTVKIVNSITPRITAEAGTVIQIRVGTQFNPDDTIVWGPERTYTVGTDREAHFSQKGRFISVRMRTDAIGANWVCHGFFIKGKTSGRY